jgi:hypothetical protein
MFENIGLTVLREIPVQTLGGLLSGAYTLHGGVVRDAGGRIVAHLLTSGPVDLLKGAIPGVQMLASLVGSGQIYSLARDVKQVQQTLTTVLAVAGTGAVLSGIGLVASVGGTIYLGRKLSAVQDQLGRIERLLNDHHVAALKSAVDNMRHAEHAGDNETRKAMLISAKTEFSKAAHFYGNQFADARFEEILALNECFVLAVMGHAMCLSELGMLGAAAADFDGHLDRWRSIARQHVQTHVLGESPYRLLSETFVEDFSAADVVATMDFADGTHKGWQWIDELRRQKAGKGVIGMPARGPSDKATKAAVPMLKLLLARSPVLDTFGEHLRFLDAKRLRIGEFTRKAEERRKEIDAPVICIAAQAG